MEQTEREHDEDVHHVEDSCQFDIYVAGPVRCPVLPIHVNLARIG